MNPLNSKYYPKIMYLALIVVSLLILFNIVNILDTKNNKTHEKSLTGFAIKNIDNSEAYLTNSSEFSNKTISNDSPTTSGIVYNETNDTSINSTTNDLIAKNSELYSSRSYFIFHTFLVGIIVAILVTFLVLRYTVNKNIELEEKSRRL